MFVILLVCFKYFVHVLFFGCAYCMYIKLVYCMFVQGSTENQFTEWIPCLKITLQLQLQLQV